MVNRTNEIKAVLLSHGDVFTGGPGRVDDIAQEWMDYGFGASQVEAWAAVGVWGPHVAAELVTAGITPRQLAKAVSDADGDPVYAACNGDLSVEELIAQVESYWA